MEVEKKIFLVIYIIYYITILVLPSYNLNLSTRDHEFHNLSKVLHGHHNLALSFTQIYIGVEKKFF